MDLRIVVEAEAILLCVAAVASLVLRRARLQ